jgi:hypothetical protein
MSEVPWLIITGSGLDNWIYWHFYCNFLDCNQLQQLTISDCLKLAPFLTGLRVSSLPLWLTWFLFTSRSLLFSFRCPLVNTPQLNTHLLNWLLNSLTPDRRITAHLRLTWTELNFRIRVSRSQNYFKTGGLQPVGSSWWQTPWDRI